MRWKSPARFPLHQLPLPSRCVHLRAILLTARLHTACPYNYHDGTTASHRASFRHGSIHATCPHNHRYGASACIFAPFSHGGNHTGRPHHYRDGANCVPSCAMQCWRGLHYLPPQPLPPSKYVHLHVMRLRAGVHTACTHNHHRGATTGHRAPFNHGGFHAWRYHHVLHDAGADTHTACGHCYAHIGGYRYHRSGGGAHYHTTRIDRLASHCQSSTT